MIGPTKAMKKYARKNPMRSTLTKAELLKWEELGYLAGVVNRDMRVPEHGMVAAPCVQKAQDAYKAGWWRGFSQYQKQKAQTA
jgi:hypothetical protein